MTLVLLLTPDIVTVKLFSRFIAILAEPPGSAFTKPPFARTPAAAPCVLELKVETLTEHVNSTEQL